LRAGLIPLAATFGLSALTLGLISLERDVERSSRRSPPRSVFSRRSFLKRAASLRCWSGFSYWPGGRNHWLSSPDGLSIALAVVAIYGACDSVRRRVDPPQSASIDNEIASALIARAFAEYAGLFLLPTNLRMERDVQMFGQCRETMREMKCAGTANRARAF
jgi:hypothetical protein